MNYTPLTREDMIRVIEGRGNADRVPMMLHFWIPVNAFEERKGMAQAILDQYPMDAQVMPVQIPATYQAPAEDPSYRWSYKDREKASAAYDSDQVIADWDEELDKLLADFPDPDSPAIVWNSLPECGQYRIGAWWYFYFERFWSLRGMEDALTDFYLYPEAVHALFRKLTDFYKRFITRAHQELHLDAILTSDDLGTQCTTFFSPEIFDQFFYPYYQEVIDHVHALGMHFWLHTCGNVEALIPRFVKLGVDVLHPIQKYTMDEQEIARKYGDQIAIWAGFDVQRTIPFGTPEDVRREVRFMMDTYARKDGRFMFTLGNGATGDTTIPSLEALFDEAFTYGTQIIQKKKQEDIHMQRVCDFLKTAGVYYLATVEGDQPRVRPFGTAHIFEGKLYIQTGKVKPVSQQLAANPKAEICAFKDGVWLRVAAELVEDDRVEAKKSMLDEYSNLRAMYDENDGNTQVLYLKNAVATFSSFTAPAETITF